MALTQKKKDIKCLIFILKARVFFYGLFRDTYGRQLKIGDYVRINTTYEK